MHQSIQGKEVTFKDVLILFFKKFERILAVALIFAVLFAAYGAWRGYSAISGENMQQQLDDYQIALDEYNASTQSCATPSSGTSSGWTACRPTPSRASTTIWTPTMRRSAS